MSELSSRDNRARRNGQVVIMVDSFPALSETFVLDQIDALAARGVNLRIVAGFRNKSGLMQEKGRRFGEQALYAEDHMGPLKHLPLIIRRRIFPLRFQKRIYQELLAGADLVLCHFGPVGRRAALALNDNQDCQLWTIFHGYDMSWYVKKYGPSVYSQLFRRADRCLAVNRLWLRRLEEMGCPKDRTMLLRMGIDIEKFEYVSRSIDRDRELKILSIGRLVEKKGLEFGLRAVAEFGRQRPDFKWSYEIIGEGALGPRLRNLARKLDIQDHVIFLNGVPAEEVRAKLAQVDIFMLPSVTARNGDMEGIPVSLMEAMATGVPVLSSFHSGIPELIDHAANGLLSPERDYLSLAKNLCRLVDDPCFATSLAVAARTKVELEFNQQRVADDLVSEINRALDAASTG
jgi:colanic acid/amylovoran biosynthesis glycosyltransferase